MGRSSCCSKDGLNRGAWTAIEDNILIDYIKAHGVGQWKYLAKKADLKRCGKSCRLRWFNYLRPDIKRGNIAEDEDDLIIRLHKLLGNRWSLIAARLPGRTDNEIKNYCNTTLRKKIQAQRSSSPSKQKPKSRSMNKKPATGTGPLIAEPAVPPLRTEPQVIRTKSLRCTKILFPSPPQPPLSSPNNNHGDGVISTKKKTSEELQVHQSQSSSPLGSDNMMMDYGIEEFSVPYFLDLDSNFLNSGHGDFQARDNMNGSGHDYSNNLSATSNFSLQFNEPMLEDWTGTNFLEPNASFDLQSLFPFSWLEMGLDVWDI